MISGERGDQLKPLHSAVTASSVQQDIIEGNKEISLSPLIYRQWFTVLHATQLLGSWYHRDEKDL